MKTFVGDPAPAGKGGLKTKGEGASTKKLLDHARVSADKYGRKK